MEYWNLGNLGGARKTNLTEPFPFLGCGRKKLLYCYIYIYG
jgi:hypothetical protein